MDTVACNNCGKQLEEDANLKPEQRKPCPVCGSLTRNFSVTTVTLAGVSAMASVGTITANPQSLPSVSELLLQTVIVAGDKTHEGTLIQAVAIPWFEIIALLEKDPQVAFQIPSDKWEEIIAGAYSKSGFEEVTLTPRSGDYGRDVIAIKKGLGHSTRRGWIRR
jgi:restriction system protein